MRHAVIGAALLGVIALLAFTVARQPVGVGQTLAQSKASRTLKPGDQSLPESTITLAPSETLVQRFTPRGAGPSTLTLRFPSPEGEPTPELFMALRDPHGEIVQTWTVPGKAAKSRFDFFTTDRVPLQGPRDGSYTLELEIVRDRVIVGGWALDTTARAGTGVDRVVLFRDGPPGVGAYLGEAIYGSKRPDTGVAFKSSRFEAAGWQYSWDTSGIVGGQHELFVYAHATASDSWVGVSRSVVIDDNRGVRDPVARMGSPDDAGPYIGPIVPMGNIAVKVDRPQVDDGSDPVGTIDIAYGERDCDPSGALTLSGRPQAGNLALTVTSSVPVGVYLRRYPAMLTAGRPAPVAALLLAMHALWLLGAAGTVGTVAAIMTRR